MSVLFINIPGTDLLKIWAPSLWYLLKHNSEASLGILDLVPQSKTTPSVPDIGIDIRIDWRFKSELDPQSLNGKQIRWLRKWLGEHQFSIALYGENDISTHIVRSIVDIGHAVNLQHVVLPLRNDCDFLVEIYQDTIH